MIKLEEKQIKSEIADLGDIKVSIDNDRIYLIRNNELYGENDGLVLTHSEFEQIKKVVK